MIKKEKNLKGNSHIFIICGVSHKIFFFSHISLFAAIGIGYSVHMTGPLCV